MLRRHIRHQTDIIKYAEFFFYQKFDRQWSRGVDSAFNVDKGKITNLGLTQQEEVKNRKHGPFYAQIGFAFLPFATSCFGSFGPTTTRFLFALTNLESVGHDESRHRQGLDPLLDPSARSQYRALCYRHITARLGHAVAKAIVMRLLALPRLPLRPSTDRSSLARNRPGPADSFSVPCPLLFSCFLYL